MISTHILDTSKGMPASGVTVSLEIRLHDEWKSIEKQNTDEDGRIAFKCPYEKGVYRLMFDVDPYFAREGVENFFLRTPVIFKVTDTGRKYHVPLLLNPFGYSTYRGS